MKWVTDRTGKLAMRPHFEPEELDNECEGIIGAFLRAQHGSVDFPVKTNDLMVLLEQETSDVDWYADLSDEGDDVEGTTELVRRGKPKVCIVRILSEQSWRENRLRTTITHELGHVKFHMPLFAVESKQSNLIQLQPEKISPRCKREAILNANPIDWMEWQAGYVSGSILMPITPLKKIVRDFVNGEGIYGQIAVKSPAGLGLTQIVQKMFQVSADAAVVRLTKLGYFGDKVAPARSLFNS